MCWFNKKNYNLMNERCIPSFDGFKKSGRRTWTILLSVLCFVGGESLVTPNATFR